MKFALWYSVCVRDWYLLDWTKVQHDKDTILGPYNIAYEATAKEPFLPNTGGFRWDDCGAVHFFAEYPAREVQSIKLGHKRSYYVKPKIIKSK